MEKAKQLTYLSSGDNSIQRYSFTQNAIRLDRDKNREPKELIQIDKSNDQMLHFYWDQSLEEMVVKRFDLTKQENERDAEFTYQLVEDYEKCKDVLGFECHYLRIEERVETHEGKYTGNRIFELYVTDDLNLPFYLVVPLWKPVTEYCALEIKMIAASDPESTLTLKAVELKDDVDPDIVKLSNEYLKILESNG